MNELIKVYYYNPELGRYSKRAYWNVRIKGEVHQMWFGTKRAALGYLARRGGAEPVVHHIIITSKPRSVKRWP